MIRKYVGIFILISVLLLIIFIVIHGMTGSYYKIIYENHFIDPIKAYEIDQNFSLEQIISIPAGDEKNITIFILMKSNEKHNDNNILFFLTQDDLTEEIQIKKFKYFGENSYIQLDFNSVEFHEGNATLGIKGLENSKGSAATVWITEDISHGIAVVNGEETNKSLRIKYAIRAENPYYSLKGGWPIFLIWVSTYVLIIFVFYQYCQTKNFIYPKN